MFTQGEYDVAKQGHRELYSKFELLNFEYDIVDELSGVIIGEPSFTNDANSDIRRTCSLQIHPTDATFDIAKGNKIWLDKYIRIYVGIKNDITNEIIYTKMGTYIVDAPTIDYSASSNTLSLNCLDLMAKLTGLRNGNLRGMSYIIPSGQNVREAMISTLQLAGFDKFVIEECPIALPLNININSGGTVFGILSELKNVYPNYQIYFDVDGVFHYDKIPSGDNEDVVVDDDLWNKTLISYNKATDFSSLKNVIEVYGKTHEVEYFADVDNVEIENNKYIITIPTLKELTQDTKIGFIAPNRIESDNIEISIYTSEGEGEEEIKTLLGTFPLNDDYGNPLEYTELEDSNDIYYVIKFKCGEDYFNSNIIEGLYNVATISNNVFYIEDDDISILEDGTKVRFTTPNDGCEYAYMPNVIINHGEYVYRIQDRMLLENNTSYEITFVKNSDNNDLKYFEFMSQVTPSAIAQDDNENSPFYVGGTIGEIRIVLSGGEYDNIYTQELAKQRAEYELYLRCRLLDNVTINCVPIYWLDVNWVVEITLPNKYGIETTEKYIIKSINTTFGVSSAQSITLMKYYATEGV